MSGGCRCRSLARFQGCIMWFLVPGGWRGLGYAMVVDLGAHGEALPSQAGGGVVAAVICVPIVHREFARWTRGCDLDQYRGDKVQGDCVAWAASCWRVPSLAARGWRWLCSAVGVVSMLTSTVWYTQLAVSPSVGSLARTHACVGGGSRGYRRRVPSSFCGRGGPGVGGRLSVMWD